MKKLIVFLLILSNITDFSSTIASGQVDSIKRSKLLISDEVKSRGGDTIIGSMSDEIFLTTTNDNLDRADNWLSSNMPWIGAILIGLLTVGANIFISGQSRKSNSTIVSEQIKNTKELASQQMELSRLNSERDFNKTVISGARQLWINDFRIVMSDLLSLIAVFSLKQHMDDVRYKKLQFLIVKAELMLSDDPMQLLLKQQLNELEKCCANVMIGNNSFEELQAKIIILKNQTSTILHEELVKARNGE